MTLPSILNEDRHVSTDVTVCSVTSTSGSVVSNVLGELKSVTINLKRVYANVTAMTDGFSSRRPVRWGEGSVDMEGFAQVNGSQFAGLFANGATATLQFQFSNTGDLWQLQVTNDEWSSKIAELETTDTIKMTQVGTPYRGTGGSAVSALPLGA